MKKVILTLVVLGVVGASIGFYMFNKPLESVQSMKTEISLDAPTLLAAYEANEEEANTNYLDKIIEVNGQVLKFEESEGKMTVYLDAQNDMSNVIFQLEKPISGLDVGQNITLKGICTGYLMDVVLVRAIQV